MQNLDPEDLEHTQSIHHRLCQRAILGPVALRLQVGRVSINLKLTQGTFYLGTPVFPFQLNLTYAIFKVGSGIRRKKKEILK